MIPIKPRSRISDEGLARLRENAKKAQAARAAVWAEHPPLPGETYEARKERLSRERAERELIRLLPAELQKQAMREHERNRKARERAARGVTPRPAPAPSPTKAPRAGISEQTLHSLYLKAKSFCDEWERHLATSVEPPVA